VCSFRNCDIKGNRKTNLVWPVRRIGGRNATQPLRYAALSVSQMDGAQLEAADPGVFMAEYKLFACWDKLTRLQLRAR
jgi:hypothetical protein